MVKLFYFTLALLIVSLQTNPVKSIVLDIDFLNSLNMNVFPGFLVLNLIFFVKFKGKIKVFCYNCIFYFKISLLLPLKRKFILVF